MRLRPLQLSMRVAGSFFFLGLARWVEAHPISRHRAWCLYDVAQAGTLALTHIPTLSLRTWMFTDVEDVEGAEDESTNIALPARRCPHVAHIGCIAPIHIAYSPALRMQRTSHVTRRAPHGHRGRVDWRLSSGTKERTSNQGGAFPSFRSFSVFGFASLSERGKGRVGACTPSCLPQHLSFSERASDGSVNLKLERARAGVAAGK
ncbi:hypothetical protein B0H19DRAFT_1185145 [Mycena capillaripes]|nr:hypothetical protein B0H19DRAFT_1185145 [Mycena capillaripes]